MKDLSHFCKDFHRHRQHHICSSSTYSRNMKCWTAALLALLATTCFADSEECTEDRAEACIDTLLSALSEDISEEEEVCREIRSSVDCLREAVDQCLGEDKDQDIEEGLEDLEKILRDHCKEEQQEEGPTDDEREEIKICFEKNQDYLFECIDLVSEEAVSDLQRNENLDENTAKCRSFARMGSCFIGRIRNKCGQTAAKMAEEALLSYAPEEIKEACDAAGIITNSLDFLYSKRKK